jgi:hypothetical protein
MLENIKFKIDEVGAKVENEAVIKMLCKSVSRETHKRLIFDKPFWVVMRQKGSHPYFLTQINNRDVMKIY